MKLLMISPCFAPIGGIGSARMVSLTKYLLRAGDQVTVLCNQEDLASISPNARCAVPDGITVIRVAKPKSDKEGAAIYQEALVQLLDTEQFDLLLFTMGPYYANYLVGDLFQSGIQSYLLDYRDLWIKLGSDQMSWRAFWGSVRRFRQMHQLEKAAIRNAKAVVTVSEPSKRQMQKMYREFRDQIVCIPNGYETEIAMAPTDVTFGPNTFVIAGKFAYYNRKAAEMLLKAIDRLNQSGHACALAHIGVREEALAEIVTKHGLDPNCVIELGQQPYPVCMSLMQQAKACVLVDNSVKGIGTKIYDYIYLDKPILAILPKKSEQERILKEFPGAHVCFRQKEVETALLSMITQDTLRLGCEDKTVYSREYQNHAYRQLMRDCIGQNESAG